MTNTQIMLTIIISAAVTAFLRFAPFVIFRNEEKAPAFVKWLGARLPKAAMAMLLVYCLKDLSLQGTENWLPSVAGVAVTVLLHVWKKQMIFSIVGGTALYMILIRII